jgi:hypothetical protein
MLAIVAVVETFVAHDVLDFTDPVSLSWRLAARSARDEAPGREVLCLGDSLVKHAMIPRAIAARSGRSAVNLAVAKGSAPSTFFLFRRALEAGARPAALVVDFKPSILIGGAHHNLRYWQEVLDFREGLELARAARSATLFSRLILGQVLPSVRSRLEIRSNLLAALRGETDVLRGLNRVCRRNWLLNDGANVAAKNPTYQGELGLDGDRKYLTHSFHCDPLNARYIGRLFDLAAARGIRVYWLLPPLAPALQARREERGAEAGYLAFVRRLQRLHPNVTILDGRHASYDHRLFVDATHLDGQGAYTLSRDVAAALGHDLDRNRECAGTARDEPRWVDLPAYRPCPVEMALEDVEQSRGALGLTR